MFYFDENAHEIIVDFNYEKQSCKNRKRNGSFRTKEEYDKNRIEKLHEEIIIYFHEHSYKSLTDIYTIKTKLDEILYVCGCSKIKKRSFKKILEYGTCKTCKSIKRHTLKSPENCKKWTDENTGENFVETPEGLTFSSNGYVYKSDDITKTHLLIKNGKFFFKRRYHQLSRLFYIAFKLENYNLLQSKEKDYFIVSFRDENNQNFKIDNLYIRNRGDLGVSNLLKRQKL